MRAKPSSTHSLAVARPPKMILEHGWKMSLNASPSKKDLETLLPYNWNVTDNP